jgi:hypothetical protein
MVSAARRLAVLLVRFGQIVHSLCLVAKDHLQMPIMSLSHRNDFPPRPPSLDTG